MHHYVMLASELYSLPILRPLAREAVARGHRVAWLSCDAIAERLLPDEIRLRLRSRRALRAFAPDATFCTVNEPPRLLPGRQIQVFHGLNMHKRDPLREGQLKVEGLFDLYCTHGPATTDPLRATAHARGDFAVVETGWSKVDRLFDTGADAAAIEAVRGAARGRPVVVYASTFDPPSSQSRECLQAIEALVARGGHYWLLCLHPLSAPDIVARYRELDGEHAMFVDAEHLPACLAAADALVGDTTSVVDEFALLGRPIVTVRHRRPQPFMHDVRGPQHIEDALRTVLASPEDVERRACMAEYFSRVHPYRDGDSAVRVLDAADALVAGALAPTRRRVPQFWRKWRRSRRQMRTLLPDPGGVARTLARLRRSSP